MKSPFFVFNSIAETIENIKEKAINRENEIEKMYDALVNRNHNVLLYGERGVGKTFLLRLLKERIDKNCKSVFTTLINLASLRRYSTYEDTLAFPRAVLLQLCTNIWTQILKKSYLKLRGGLHVDSREFLLMKKPEKTIQRIYSELMLLETKISYKQLNTIGVSAGIKGELKGEKTSSRKLFDILPFEFGEFIKEIIENTLVKTNIDKIIVLCDEGNLIPIFKQEEILENYLEMFSSKKVQFIFVAGHHSWENKPYLPSCFETNINLVGFSKSEYIRELINQVDLGEIKFSNEAIDVLFESLKGHPRYTIGVCDKAFSEAVSSQKNNISASKF